MKAYISFAGVSQRIVFIWKRDSATHMPSGHSNLTIALTGEVSTTYQHNNKTKVVAKFIQSRRRMLFCIIQEHSLTTRTVAIGDAAGTASLLGMILKSCCAKKNVPSRVKGFGKLSSFPVESIKSFDLADSLVDIERVLSRAQSCCAEK